MLRNFFCIRRISYQMCTHNKSCKNFASQFSLSSPSLCLCLYQSVCLSVSLSLSLSLSLCIYIYIYRERENLPTIYMLRIFFVFKEFYNKRVRINCVKILPPPILSLSFTLSLSLYIYIYIFIICRPYIWMQIYTYIHIIWLILMVCQLI